MRREGAALRLTILIGENDTVHHRPLYREIVHRAQHAGLAGATVVRGIEGYGASGHVQTARILSLSEDLPLMIVLVDAEDKIRAFLPELDELVTDGLVLTEPVHAVRYSGGPGD
ncbi:DUF190 domain-containing protein [Actinomadura atramentaria]|uniref:DUF190 domain-containing protein n=1 Tax=Actinomadura atramentaria TaxID=1990 RepID=UPI000373FBBA|nr:DUF190 domain-containing protein [Actinomadura atramentaria]